MFIYLGNQWTYNEMSTIIISGLLLFRYFIPNIKQKRSNNKNKNINASERSIDRITLINHENDNNHNQNSINSINSKYSNNIVSIIQNMISN